MAKQGNTGQPEMETRQRYMKSRTGDLTSYAALLGESFASRINLPAQILRDAHDATLGRYKERLLMEFIDHYIPQRYAVGSGFVVFPKEPHFEKEVPEGFNLLTFSEHVVSRQCDIIVYESNNCPVVFKDEDFVIVRPESVRSVVEVKGTLTVKSTKQAVKNFVDFARKWQECSQFYANKGLSLPTSPRLFLWGWQKYVDPKGKASIDGKRLRERIVEIYRKNLTRDEIFELGNEGCIRQFPILDAAFIYDDCIVDWLLESGEDGANQFGLWTYRGQFVRSIDDRLERAGDKTVASLLDMVRLPLEDPRNPLFQSVDQSNRIDIHPHPDQGFTPWTDDADKEISWR